MKKGLKRGFAAAIALLMLGCQILPSIGTIASNNGENTDETVQDAYVKYEFENLDLTTMTDWKSTKFARNANTLIDGETDQAASKHWWTGTSMNSQVSQANRRNSGLKPNTHDKNTHRLDITEGSESFELTAKIYYKDMYGIVFGKRNVYPDGNGSYGAAYVGFAPITNGGLDVRGFSNISKTGADATSISGTRVNIDKLKQNANTNNVAGNLLTLHIKVTGSDVKIWLDEYDVQIQATLADSYELGTISLVAKEYQGGGGFKSLEIMKYDVSYNFENLDLSTMTDWKSTKFARNANTLIDGETDQAASKHWWTGTSMNSQVSQANRRNSGLKPNTHDKNTHRLDIAEGSESFELTAKIYYKDMYGIVFGKRNVYPDGNGSYGAAYVGFAPITNGGLDVRGFSNISKTGADATSISGTRVNIDKLKQNANTNNVAGNLLTLHIKVTGSDVKIWLDEYDVQIQATLADSYEVGTISLVAKEYQGGGGFKSIWIKNWISEQEVEIPATPAVVGDSFEKDFTKLSSVTDLDDEFASYYFESNTATATKGKPSEQWAIGTSVYASSTVSALRNNWLKPTHKSSGSKHTLLSYKSKIFTNVEVEAEYVTNHLRYGVMIAPEGQLSTAQNGVRVYVDGSGLIKMEGAIDAGTATATGGYVYVGGQNILSGYAVPGYVKASSTASNASNCTSYTIHIRITGKVMQVWLNECPTYVISVQLTDAYKGGMVSLYSTGNDHGAFKSFSAIENEGTTSVEDGNVFTQSFNTISSTDELKDKFDAYTLGASKTENPVAANVEDIYHITGGMLKSNLTKAGTDYSDFGILTFKDKRYENFELTLKYVQDPSRYAVMIGTEPGEFAFSGDASHVNGNGGVLVYTEMEGYRNIKGSLYASSYTNAKIAVHKKTENPKLESFVAFKSEGKSDVLATLEKKPIHTMTIRVVDGYLTMLVDNNEASRVTVRLADYDGGYISLVTNVNKNSSSSYGGVVSLAVKELGEDAELNTTLPETGEEFETIKQVEKLFDAYYLENVKESSKLKKEKLKDRWWLNKGGFLTRVNGNSTIDVNGNMDILTYKKEKFTDFELTYSYQQTYQRTGIFIGGDLGEYVLSYDKDGKLTADKGTLLYIEAEGVTNVKGHLKNYTAKADLLYRNTTLVPEGFTNAAGSASEHVNAKTEHVVKVVVKDKKLYVFLDGSEEPSLYVKLGDNYKGGYISLFSSANSQYGIGNFTISDKITTKLPKAGGAQVVDDTLIATFDTAEFNDSLFTTYYLEAVKNNEKGAMKKTAFDEQWTVANKVLKRTSAIANGSDEARVSVLTYDKKLTDFVATYEYQQDSNRLMFMFGTEKGKYPLCHNGKGTLQINGGVLLYPEFNLGNGGGLIAKGDVYPLTSSYTPISYEKLNGLDYYNKDNGGVNAHLGKWHTITIAVINKHCYVYIDDYGLVHDFSLGDDYKGGYVSLAATGNTYGFRNLKIQNLKSLTKETVVSAENPRDLTVEVGTQISALQLPTTVKVTLKNGKTVDAKIDWNNMNYNPEVAGNYKFTAVVKESSTIENPGLVGVEINIRVVEKVKNQSSSVKEWTFDTNDDLKDFQTTFVKNEETGYSTSDVPLWFVNESTGNLHRDEFRTVSGNETSNVAVMTYAGEKYKNFELEVDYSWHSTRMMVMFGSEEIGAYIDLKDKKSDENPVAVFVEMEGVPNVIGNVRNTNYYNRTDKMISNARSNGDRIPNYYNKENLQGNIGTMHHMKIRVEGQQLSVWIDDYKEPFVTELTNYDGGYISLVSTTKGGVFDNLKITRLSDSLESEIKETEPVANGVTNVKIDTNGSTELVLPEREAPETFGEINLGKSIPFVIVGGGIVLATTIIGFSLVLFTWLKRKKGERN